MMQYSFKLYTNKRRENFHLLNARIIAKTHVNYIVTSIALKSFHSSLYIISNYTNSSGWSLNANYL